MASVGDTGATGPTRHGIQVAKYENNREPVGEPDDIIEQVFWTEADGTSIEDEDRIAALEAGLRAAHAAQEGNHGQEE